MNGLLLFGAAEPVAGTELYRSDGTEAGTFLVRDINPGPASGAPSIIFIEPPDFPAAVIGGALYFKANDGAHGVELWKSDGTADGTALVKDINPGTAGALDDADFATTASLVDVNGTLFFRSNDGAHGFELWKSDGTEAGTVLVKDINPGLPGAFFAFDYPLVNLNGTLFFAADNGSAGIDLWRSNGTEAGTALVMDIFPGDASSSPRGLADVNGTLFFGATDPTHGRELWSLRADPPRVVSAVINNGAAQRSMLTGVIVTFSDVVTLTDGAFTVRRADGTAVGLTVTPAVVNGRTVVSLAFTGPDVVGGSLADGRYTLTINGKLVGGESGLQLDGDGNGTAGGDYALPSAAGLYRLFGDANGDGVVNGADFTLFRSAFGAGPTNPNYNAAFDLNGDGVINGFDFNEFRTRFGISI